MSAHPLDPFVCVTAPCGPYTPSRVTTLLTQPSSLSIPRMQPGNAAARYMPTLHGIPSLATLMSYDGPPIPQGGWIAPAVSAAARAGISAAENEEIDAAIQEQELRAERIEQLGEFKSTIHPDRLLDIAGNIAEGRYATVPLPARAVGPPQLVVVEPEPTPPPPRTQEPTGIVRTPSVGPPVFLGGLVPAAREAEPDLYEAESEEEPMADLSDILGTVSQLADIYTTVRGPAQAPAAILPSEYPGSVRDWVDGPTDWLAPSPVTSLPTTTGGTMAGYSGGCISNRDRQIAAASGVSAESVDRVLYYARQGRRRRRRMLTKSDIGDISTMKSILGNGEAFKMWLAKATR